MGFISEGFFWKIFKNEDLGLIFFYLVYILMLFSSLVPSKMIFFLTKDTIFNMGYGSGKSPMGERV